MNRHVCLRLTSSLPLPAVIFCQLPTPAIAQSAASTTATPTLAERLDRLAAEFDRNRIDLHVPGAGLAIVRGEEVIFARGFGVADVEKKTSVTPDTPFLIGSTTKAFTATLVGMLVDEGRMQWDDPVEKYLPEFKLKVQSKDPNDRATLRDVLSHRTGFTCMVLHADWRKYYDTIRVVRAGELGGRKVYGIQLESAGLSPLRVTVDAETGDVLQTQQAMWIPEAGAISTTTTYSDYREVGGMRVPHHYIVSTEVAGRTLFQVERVELALDTFTLQPSTVSGRGK